MRHNWEITCKTLQIAPTPRHGAITGIRLRPGDNRCLISRFDYAEMSQNFSYSYQIRLCPWHQRACSWGANLWLSLNCLNKDGQCAIRCARGVCCESTRSAFDSFDTFTHSVSYWRLGRCWKFAVKWANLI